MHPRILLTLALMLSLGSCDQNEPDPSRSKADESGVSKEQAEKPLPLSPGIRIASIHSGGIAGISESVQVTYDWKLIVVGEGDSFVRPINGEEQKQINAALKPFHTMLRQQSDEVPDGFSSVLVAQGTGEGEGTAEHAQQLGMVLGELIRAPR